MPRPTYNHECYATGCQVKIPTNRLMCVAHWMKVPAQLRTDIWEGYKRIKNRAISIEEREEAQARYNMARDAAAKAVADKEAS